MRRRSARAAVTGRPGNRLAGPRPDKNDIIVNMKTISVSVSKEDYAAFRRGSKRLQRSIAQLIREAMALYREQRLEEKTRLSSLPVLVGHRALGSPPSRAELYEEIFARESSGR